MSGAEAWRSEDTQACSCKVLFDAWCASALTKRDASRHGGLSRAQRHKALSSRRQACASQVILIATAEFRLSRYCRPLYFDPCKILTTAQLSAPSCPT